MYVVASSNSIDFFPRSAVHSAGYAIASCLSVYPVPARGYVTLRYCVKMVKHIFHPSI